MRTCRTILAPWTKARQWAAERAKVERWREVRAYNLDRVDAWLDSAPGTTAWLAEHLGKALPGVRSVESWWDDTWLPSTRLPLTADIVLAGREKAVSSLLALLSRNSKVVTLGGNIRIDELRAVVAASLARDGGVEGMVLRARTLFVSDRHSLEQSSPISVSARRSDSCSRRRED